MRVAFVTVGRFHLCDLARELTALGHDIEFWSLVPPWRTKKFGVPANANRWLGAELAIPYGAYRAARGTPLENAAEWAMVSALDRVVASRLGRVDAVIGLSGLSVRVIDAAHRRGAKFFLERCSRHILSQRDILERAATVSGQRARPVPDHAVDRELAGYALADRIVVPAKHVVRSFLDHKFPEERVFRNPFGVSLASFPPTASPRHEQPVIIMVGAWSVRKGCDILVDAVSAMKGVKLLHVGPVLDCPLPREAWFEHHDPVPQDQLTRFYARADVAVLASREEGLAFVQAQALASGLPLVCSDRTGGEDLRDLISDPSMITVVPAEDVAALRNALTEAVQRATSGRGERNALRVQHDQLSWSAYARRYEQKLLETIG